MACETSAENTIFVPHNGTVDLDAFVLSRASGKSVLNIGASGNMLAYLPDRPELSLHMRLKTVAEVVGIDIDREAIEHANRHGADLVYADCQDFSLGRTFDLILMIDVIEHLERPGDALDAATRHLAPNGQLVVSTPNAAFWMSSVKAALGRAPGIYYDHVTCFFPENLKALVERHGMEVSELYFHTLMNNFTRSAAIKSNVLRWVGRIAPRVSNSFVAAINHRSTQR